MTNQFRKKLERVAELIESKNELQVRLERVMEELAGIFGEEGPVGERPEPKEPKEPKRKYKKRKKDPEPEPETGMTNRNQVIANRRESVRRLIASGKSAKDAAGDLEIGIMTVREDIRVMGGVAAIRPEEPEKTEPKEKKSPGRPKAKSREEVIDEFDNPPDPEPGMNRWRCSECERIQNSFEKPDECECGNTILIQL